MSLFSQKENRVRCGRCSTEFDLLKNQDNCPLCGFGKHLFGNNNEVSTPILSNTPMQAISTEKSYLSIPNELNLPSGKVILDSESSTVGLWGMVNDFFSGKALLRISANIIHEKKEEYVCLYDLIEVTQEVMLGNNKLKGLKGFPSNPKEEPSVNRLVYHFMNGFHKMGLFDVKIEGKSKGNNIWKEDWKNVLVRPTREGLQFARLKNKIFDDKTYEDQTLTVEEKAWLVRYLQKIDKDGFKEYTVLSGVLSFIKQGKNGNKDLWGWFKKNPSFIAYIKSWSAKTGDAEAFEKQIDNLAQTFSAGKISLLREIGVIKNKRNDYTVIGDLK